TELRILQMKWMKRFEEIHPHPSTKVDGQADRCVQDRKNARPDAQIAAQVKAGWIGAGGVGPASQNVPWAEPQRYREKEQTCVGGSHAQSMTNVWRSGRSIGQTGDRD